MTTRLIWTTTTSPDFGGFRFYVEEGRLFDADDYAKAYGLDPHEIDAQDIHAVQGATGHLNHGEWLEVSHEIETD